jgi:thiol:disulfide interchange protein DsbA
MMFRPLALIALLSFSVAACGRDPPAAPRPANTPAASAPAPSSPGASASAATAPQAVEQTSGEAAQAQETGDSGSDSRGDTALERLAALTPAQQPPAGRWKVGTHYIPLLPAQPTSAAPGKVEVVEVFWYGCPHCYALEPYLESWDKSKPSYVEFMRVPVMWSGVHRAHARLYYTLEALGRSDLHKAVFDTIHGRSNMLVSNDDARTLEMDVAFAQAHGIEPEAFKKAWNSFSVNSSLQRAEELTRRYKVEGVPLVVINGKYISDVGHAGGQNELVALIKDLTASENHR